MIYIQTAEGLSQVSPSLTKEKIIAALGYTPADNLTFYEDESGVLAIVDNNGYVVAKIGAAGLETVEVSAKAIKLNGQDLAAKLQALEEKSVDIDLSDYALAETALDSFAFTFDGSATNGTMDFVTPILFHKFQHYLCELYQFSSGKSSGTLWLYGVPRLPIVGRK